MTAAISSLSTATKVRLGLTRPLSRPLSRHTHTPLVLPAAGRSHRTRPCIEHARNAVASNCSAESRAKTRSAEARNSILTGPVSRVGTGAEDG